MAENKRVNNIVLEGARIWARNFAGKEQKFNPAGQRNFNVWLDEDLAKDLAADGWNVKYYIPKNDPDAPARPFLKVSLSFDYFPPKIFRVGGNGKPVPLDEVSVSTLDWEEIVNVDITIRPYCWEVNGKTGIKAYVKTMYVVVEEDAFESKYAQEDSFPTADNGMEAPWT